MSNSELSGDALSRAAAFDRFFRGYQHSITIRVSEAFEWFKHGWDERAKRAPSPPGKGQCVGFVGGTADQHPEFCDRCGKHWGTHREALVHTEPLPDKAIAAAAAAPVLPLSLTEPIWYLLAAVGNAITPAIVKARSVGDLKSIELQAHELIEIERARMLVAHELSDKAIADGRINDAIVALVRERFAATDDVRIRITRDEFDAITNAAP